MSRADSSRRSSAARRVSARCAQLILALGLAACGSGGGSGTAGPDAGARDTSSAKESGTPPGDASVDGRSADARSPTEGGVDSGDAGLWRPFDDASPWNTVIPSGAAIDPNSSTMIADLSSIAGETTFWINIQQYSVPVYWVDSMKTPMVTVSASLGGTGFRTGAASDSASAGTGLAPIPSGAMPAAGTDKHLSIVDTMAHTEWGFWNANDGTSGWTAGEASTMDLSGDGVRPPTNDNPWWAGQGPRACGYSLIAGLITTSDVMAGVIPHALILAYPHIESRYYTPPASSAQGTTSEALPTRGIPCGGQVQLDPSLDITTLGLSPAGLVIARALQQYGAFIGDFSGAVSLYADASPTAQAYWGTGALANDDASKIPLSSLRVLELGTIYDNMN
jgi:hypothetical protein